MELVAEDVLCRHWPSAGTQSDPTEQLEANSLFGVTLCSSAQDLPHTAASAQPLEFMAKLRSLSPADHSSELRLLEQLVAVAQVLSPPVCVASVGRRGARRRTAWRGCRSSS